MTEFNEIFKHDTKKESLIYETMGISIGWGKWRCDGCEFGDKQDMGGNTIKVKYT